MFNYLRRITEALETIARNSDIMRQNQERQIERSERLYQAGQEQAAKMMSQFTGLFLPQEGGKNGK